MRTLSRSSILRVKTRIDPIQPHHGIVSYAVVAPATGTSPHRPTRRTLQGDRLSHRSRTCHRLGWRDSTVRAPQPHGQRRFTVRCLWLIQSSPSLIASELGQYLYEDGTEFHGLHCSASVRCDNARFLKSELVEKRIGLRNILPSAAPPLHHGERCRQRIHFRQLDVVIARGHCPRTLAFGMASFHATEPAS